MNENLQSLVSLLHDELGWPIDSERINRSVWKLDAAELGLNDKVDVDVGVHELRPLVPNQPWGVFFMSVEGKSQLSVTLLRRLLRGLVKKKRATAEAASKKLWETEDLMFICSLDEPGNSTRYFAHFRESEKGLPKLMIGSRWDEAQDPNEVKGELQKLRKNLHWPDDEADTDAWKKQWARGFQIGHREVIKTSVALSRALARFAVVIKQNIPEIHRIEREDGAIHKLHEAFREALIKDLKLSDFADMVAQTITYGLFSARATGIELSGIETLSECIPPTNPFLRDLFSELASLAGDEPTDLDFDDLSLDELVRMLNEINIDAVMGDFGSQFKGGKEDPVIHFYETFLSEYDHQRRVERGVFYTPKPVVDFIVSSVHERLIEDFDLPLGLADTSTHKVNGKEWPKVMVLDPATGTGTFLEVTIDIIHETMLHHWKGQGKSKSEISALWNEYVDEHLLPRLYGFELMMAPYSIAHLKLGLKLQQTGYDSDSDIRLNVYLTNTLEEPAPLSTWIPDFISIESSNANSAKQEVPFSVVIGNPPYSISSQNMNPYIDGLIKDYYSIDGVDLGEKNPKALQDDYVKFIRYCTSKLTDSKNCVFSFVTNHGWLDNLTFRGMRKSILDQFSMIFTLDLNGSAMRKVSGDKNVFDIRQGVSIFIFCGMEREEKFIASSSIVGSREYKYNLLKSFELKKFNQIIPTKPHYFFVEKELNNEEEYNVGVPMTDIFVKYSPGIKTHRDRLVYSENRDDLVQIIEDSIDPNISNSVFSEKYNVGDTGSWKLDEARQKAKEIGEQHLISNIVSCIYRPLEPRYLLLSSIFADRPRMSTMQGMELNGNYSISAMRQVTGNIPYSHVIVSDSCIDDRAMYSNRGTLSFFPMYVIEGGKKRENIKTNLSSAVNLHLGILDSKSFLINESIFDYIIAFLHSNSFRTRYLESLKIGIPRIQFTSNQTLFQTLSDLGNRVKKVFDGTNTLKEKQMVELPLDVMINSTQISNEKVFLNGEQEIVNLSSELFEQYLGGYQPIIRFLKKHRGEKIDANIANQFRQLCATLHSINKVMEHIDEAIEEHGGWPLQGSETFELLPDREPGQMGLGDF